MTHTEQNKILREIIKGLMLGYDKFSISMTTRTTEDTWQSDVMAAMINGRNLIEGKLFQEEPDNDDNKSLFKIPNESPYYPVRCQTCGWIGSSEYLDGGHQIADTGDYGDCFCPACGQVDPEECEAIQDVSVYKDAALKMGELLKKTREALEDQHWKHLG